MSHNPQMWLGALATLALYSILYRENPVYRFAEHVFVGLAAGYGVYVIWRDVLVPTWWTPLTVRGEWWWVFAGIAGGMYYTLYSKRFSWMSRLVMLTTMGFTAGQGVPFLAVTSPNHISPPHHHPPSSPPAPPPPLSP